MRAVAARNIHIMVEVAAAGLIERLAFQHFEGVEAGARKGDECEPDAHNRYRFEPTALRVGKEQGGSSHCHGQNENDLPKEEGAEVDLEHAVHEVERRQC